MSETSAAERGLFATFRRARGDFSLELDLELPAHGTTVLFGPSGAGKTTLLRCVAGLERPQMARIGLGDAVFQDDARALFVPTHRRPLGYVFQDDALFPHLNVRENVAFGMRRVRPQLRRVAWEPTIELLGLGPLLDRRITELSGGERKRVGLGRALLTSPELLLLDEPLSGLDRPARRAALDYLLEVRVRWEIPMIYVSHALDELLRLADHLVLLDAGRVVDAGPVLDVTARAASFPGLEGQHGALLVASLVEHDPGAGLSRLEFLGGALWVPQVARSLGSIVRVWVRASDVSIWLEAPGRSSALNVLLARIVKVEAAGPYQTLIEAEVGLAPGRLFRALITKRSAVELGLQATQQVFLQLKTVALLTD